MSRKKPKDTDEEIKQRLARMDERAAKRMKAGATYTEAYWPARGIQAFHHSGKWTTRHTDTQVHYICTACDTTIVSFNRSVHAFTRSARGKAAVRAHILEKHPEKPG